MDGPIIGICLLLCQGGILQGVQLQPGDFSEGALRVVGPNIFPLISVGVVLTSLLDLILNISGVCVLEIYLFDI